MGISHVYNHALERAVPGRHIQAVAFKVLSNVGLFTPAAIATSFSTLSILEYGMQAGLPCAKGKILRDLPETWLAGGTYWPFVTFALFRFAPVGHRPIWGALAGATWNTFLAHQANKSNSAPPAHSALPRFAWEKIYVTQAPTEEGTDHPFAVVKLSTM